METWSKIAEIFSKAIHADCDSKNDTAEFDKALDETYSHFDDTARRHKAIEMLKDKDTSISDVLDYLKSIDE